MAEPAQDAPGRAAPGDWVEVTPETFADMLAAPCVQAAQSIRVEDGILTVIETATTWRAGRVVDIQTTIIGRYRLEVA